MPVGYSILTYEELEAARFSESQSSHHPFFYVFADGLVEKMKDSKLISELITYKETILLHLKRKTKK
jgi:transposase-like protein